MDFDAWFVERLCVAAAEMAAARYGVRSLVMPTLPFGPTPEHRGFGSGCVDLPQPVFEVVAGEVLDSLVARGFRRVLVWRGCGGHHLGALVDGFNAQHRGRARAALPALPYHDIWCRIADASVPGGHADSLATSIALHLHRMVRTTGCERTRGEGGRWPMRPARAPRTLPRHSPPGIRSIRIGAKGGSGSGGRVATEEHRRVYLVGDGLIDLIQARYPYCGQ